MSRFPPEGGIVVDLSPFPLRTLWRPIQQVVPCSVPWRVLQRDPRAALINRLRQAGHTAYCAEYCPIAYSLELCSLLWHILQSLPGRHRQVAHGTPLTRCIPSFAGISSTIGMLMLMAGCASPGAPAAPSLQLANSVNNLQATRVDRSVILSWTMPARTTDRVELKGNLRGEVCRQAGNGASCAVAGSISGQPGKPATYVDVLPSNLLQGPPQLLVYRLTLLNRFSKTAGPSNNALSVSGAGPEAVTGLTAQVRADGVLLIWHPSVSRSTPAEDLRPATIFRIERTLESPPGAPKASPSPEGEAPPMVQELVVRVPAGSDPGHALDTSAQFNQRYRYTVRRVEQLTFAGHLLEMQGKISDPLQVTTTDIFPPAAPGGLAAAADQAAGAIDLSWSPDSEADLAGYFVYRRDLGTDLTAQRVSGTTPLKAPGFRDMEISPSHRYAYSVSALDTSGNESPHSPEVVETLPAR